MLHAGGRPLLSMTDNILPSDTFFRKMGSWEPDSRINAAWYHWYVSNVKKEKVFCTNAAYRRQAIIAIDDR
jgi:hypothetical protein